MTSIQTAYSYHRQKRIRAYIVAALLRDDPTRLPGLTTNE